MSNQIELYAIERDRLLKQVTESLKKDSRFVAAWLIGSHSRNAADMISDLDIVLVVNNENGTNLLDKSWQIKAATASEWLATAPERAATASERLALFNQYGAPLYIYENHNNAPKGGTFTTVIYAGQAIIVDWSLIPVATAQRPQISRLLFAKKSIPIEPKREPESIEKRKQQIMGIIANFWLMMNVIVKYIYRHDALQFYAGLDAQIRSINEIKRLLAGTPWEYQPGSAVTLSLAREQQIKDLRRVAQMMVDLTPELAAQDLSIPDDPMKALEQRLSLLQL